MSVVYGKRGLSQMEFWKMINKIEKEIIFLLLHDFGVKTRTRSPQFYASVEHMNEADVEVKRMDQLFAELFPGADFRTQKEKRKEHDENLQHSRQGTEEAGRVAERRRTSTPW